MFRTPCKVVACTLGLVLTAAPAASARPAPPAPGPAPTGRTVVFSDTATSVASPDVAPATSVRPVVFSDTATPVTRDVSSAPQPITVNAPSTPVVADDGFEWGDAAIGAAAILGLLGIAGGLAMLGLRYRHEHPSGLVQ